jgi:TonB-linked SusC/RagA family outer membrane protein
MKLLPKTKPRNPWLTTKTWKVMKLTSILVIALTFQVSAAVSSQTITFSGKNVAFKKVLSVIKNQTDYVFFYDVTILKSVKPISINVVDAPIEKVLLQAFSDSSITWVIEGKTISFVPKVETIKKSIYLAPIQKQINGTVTDDKGGPLAGATILIKGTKRAVVTNFDGNFTIEIPDSKSVLVVSYTGFITKEVAVNTGGTSMTIKLEEDNTTLKEVVIGYGKQKSAQVVSAVSTIKGEDLRLPGRSLTNGLAGRVAGLYAIQRSGEPGYDNAEIYIRGVSSFAGGTKALILVDGVPRNMSDISTEEIETFTVLKDASATAVYGSEGANGVILITSKRGLNQKTTIDFRMDNSFNSPTRVVPFLGSGDWLRLYNEAKWNTEGNPNKASFIPYKTDAQIALYENGTDPDLYPNVNWMDMLKKVATNQKYSLNFRGGGDKMRFFVGTSYYNEEGAFLSNPVDYNEYNKNIKYDVNIGLKRFNLRSNIDMDISETTKLSVDLSGQYLTTNYPGTGTGTIFGAMMNSAPHLIPMIYSNGYPSRFNAAANYQNPYTLLNFRGYAKEYRVSLQTTVALEQRFKSIPGLIWKIKTSFDSDFTSIVRKSRTPSEYYSDSRDLNGDLIMKKIINGQNTSTEDAGGGFSGGNKRIYMETSMAYSKKLGDDHVLSGLLLVNQKESQLQDQAYPYKKQGAVGRLSYAYGNKYFTDASFGVTGSENFAPENRYGFFPAFGLGYMLTNEYKIGELIQSAGIQTLKLRVSYGRTGNDQVSNSRFPYKENLNWTSGLTTNLGMTSAGATNSSGALILENQAFNPDIRWEIEEKRNVGIDLTAWHNALSFTIDYFDNLRHDILLRRNTVGQAAGLQQNPFENFGKVSNKGVDASLNFNKKINDFSIGATGTFTFARNKIIDMDEVPRAVSYQNSTGTRLGMTDGWVAERLYTNDDFDIVANPATGAKTYTLKAGLPLSRLGSVYPGNIKYADLNNDGLINEFDWTKHVAGAKPINPEIIYGFGVNAEYKGFYASAFFQGVANVTAYLDPAFMIPFAGSLPLATSTKGFSLDRWSEENPNQNALLPRLQLNNTNQSDIRRSSWFLRDAGFLRLKNAEIGYKLEKKQLDLFGFTAARVYVLGTNLAVWDKIKYWDPEQGGSTGGSSYPIQRTISVGLDVTF